MEVMNLFGGIFFGRRVDVEFFILELELGGEILSGCDLRLELLRFGVFVF